ncbi:endonuclease [Hydrogenimonas sp.]|nr:endonuclease [Hydrogenimonas sp.]
MSLLAYADTKGVNEILEEMIKGKRDAKNLVITGIPGTGKTHAVVRFLEENKEIGGYRFVQFHPSYDYEDFIEGLKPFPDNNNLTFKLVPGIFKELCREAIKDKNKKYVMVIDEINRANLSRVFGELLYCLEYRGKPVDTKMTGYIKGLSDEDEQKKHTVDHNNENSGRFEIPENVLVIGTMNDVDRSVDAFDLALRRRFVWEEVDFDRFQLAVYDKFFERKMGIENIFALIEKAEKLNEKIEEKMGKNFRVGHTYFFKVADYLKNKDYFDSALEDLWRFHLHSLLKEYLKMHYDESEIDEELKEFEKIVVGDK